MAIIYLTSVTGAPGVSTLATALTMNWPRPVLLLEADTSKTTHLIPGYLRAEFKHDHGLTKAALANLRGALDAETLFQQTISLGEGRYAIAGFDDVGGAYGSTSSFWANLSSALNRFPQTAGAPDLDIIVDAGRYRPADARAALLAQADAVLVVSGSTLPDSNALYTSLPAILAMLDSAGHRDYVNLVLTRHPSLGPIAPTRFGPREIKALLDVDTIETLPWDAQAAGHYTYGTAAPTKSNRYLKTVRSLITALDSTLSTRSYKPQEAI